MIDQINYPWLILVSEVIPSHLFKNCFFAWLKSWGWGWGEMPFLESCICLLTLGTLAKTFEDLIVFSLFDQCWFEKFPIFHIKLLFSVTHLKYFQGSLFVITKYLVSRRFINFCEAFSLFRGIIADEPICSLFISIFRVYLPFLLLAV